MFKKRTTPDFYMRLKQWNQIFVFIFIAKYFNLEVSFEVCNFGNDTKFQLNFPKITALRLKFITGTFITEVVGNVGKQNILSQKSKTYL